MNSPSATLTLPNGVVGTYAFDNASELTGITYTKSGTTLGNLSYTYDLSGRRTIVGGTYASSGLPAAVSSTGYNANNQMTGFGSASMTYDANGNLTNDGTNSYTWDARNHLVSISGGVSASFQYDPFGRRVSKTVGATTGYVYDGANVVQELAGGNVSANLLSGIIDEAFTHTDASGTGNFITDALGSTVALVNGSGTNIASYSYEPFGKTTVTGSSTNSYEYTARENDSTGLYFNRARYYSPTQQRFISEDPIGFGGGDVNYYVYTADSPTRFTDPFGLDKDKDNDPCHGPVTPFSVNATYGLSNLGALIGEGIGGPPGLFVGYAIGSMFGAGGSITWVPQTNQFYAGPVATFSPVLGKGTGGSVTVYRFNDAQSAGNVVGGWSGSVTLQPTWSAGTTVTKSSGSPPAVGFTSGTRVPIAYSGGYNWRVWKGKCQ